MKRKLFSIAAAALILCSAGAYAVINDRPFFPAEIAAQADSVRVYNANNYAPYKTRTKAQIVSKYEQAVPLDSSYEEYDKSTYYKVPASTSAPYAAGVLTDDTLAAMEGMSNFFRWLVGVEDFSVHCTQNESLQYQALDRNFEFNHHISNDSKPADMDDELWQKGFACQHNILAWGYTPSGSIAGWMNEGYSLSTNTWDTTGHRYAIINPAYASVQYGYCGRIGVGDCVSGGSGRYMDTFSAFPAPGAMPKNLVYASESAWNADWNSGTFTIPSADAVKVTITNLSTGHSVVRTKADNTLSVKTRGVVFAQPDDYNTSTGYYDNSYKVRIEGLKDSSSSPAVIEYTVEFFDIKTMLTSRVKSAVTKYNKLVIASSWENAEGFARLEQVLPDTVTVTTDSGMKYELSTAGEWKYNSSDKKFHNSVSESALPALAKDTRGVLRDITISYEVDDDDCSWFYPATTPSYSSSIKEGTSVAFKARRYITNYKSASICRVTTDKNGRESTEIAYDTDLTPGLLTDGESNPVVFTNHSVKASDSGKYFTISYSPSEYWDEAYVSARLIDVNIVHDYTSAVTRQPSCTEPGVKTYTCSVCGDIYTETIAAKGHSFTDRVVAPTCTEKGCTQHTCSACGYSYKDAETSAKGHNFTDRVIEPTYDKQGYTQHTCTVCGYSYKDSYTPKKQRGSISGATVTVASAGNVYTGKALTPAVTVRLNGKTLRGNTDYTVRYSANTNCGRATVTVTGRGAYTGTKTADFIIKPAKAVLSRVKSPKTRQVKAVWKKSGGNVTGYQINTALNNKFTKSKKTYLVSGASATSKTFTGLKKGKTYYVRVRAYKKVGSAKYYGAWSVTKSVKCK